MSPAHAFTLISSDFQDSGKIPTQFTCHGDDTSPALSWSNAPANTKTFVLGVEDPDAPSGTFIHWVVYNIPATVLGFPQGSQQGIGGLNSFRNQSYGGPCPPSGVHHYIFTLYALDTELTLASPATLDDIKKAMSSHVLGTATLTGLYP